MSATMAHGVLIPYSPTEVQEVLIALQCCPRCGAAADKLWLSVYRDGVSESGCVVRRVEAHCGCMCVDGYVIFEKHEPWHIWRKDGNMV
jgi:hypothetical protein